MKIINPLAPAEQSAQLTIFVDFFVKEFMSEIWYLEESARGNIPGRKDASMSTLFNIACGLANLTPIPGGALGFLVSYKLIRAAIDLAKSDESGTSPPEYPAEVAEALAENTREIRSTHEDSPVDEGKPIDHESLSVLARWLGLKLAHRYEHLLCERLSTKPEEAIIGLARAGARRSLAYLSEHGGMTAPAEERTAKLLEGVVVSKSAAWYERPLKWFTRRGRLLGRDGVAKEKFYADKAFVNGAWYSPESDPSQCLVHPKTEWLKSPKQPRYGYICGTTTAPALTLLSQDAEDLRPWLARRHYQTVTLSQIIAYLESPEVKAGRTEARTASESLHQFLVRDQGLPTGSQAVYHGDLSGINLTSGNFSHVDFSGSQMNGDLSYCSFEGATLYGVTWVDVRSELGTRVNFASAHLGFSDMTGAKYQGEVDMTQANLCCVNLTGASFGAIQHVGTQWYNAKLTGVEYEGLAKAQREQFALVQAGQTAQDARFQILNSKVAELEAQVRPLLESLAAKQPVSAGAGAGGALPESQLQALRQQQALEELLAAQEKRIQFEAYCEEKLAQLTDTTETHAGQIAAMAANLKRVREESARGHAALQSQVDQLSERVDCVEAHVAGLARRSSVIKLKVDDMYSQLAQIQAQLARNQHLQISSDLSLEAREAILEKSAIQKVLDVYCRNLCQHQQDLVYYVRPDVIDRIPGNISPGDYMLAVESEKIEDSSLPLLDEVRDYLHSSQQCLLLLGEPGSGKSLFAWYSSQSRLKDYQMVLQDREPSDTPWLPIVIELKNYSLSQAIGLLPQYLKAVCHLSAEELMAIQNDQKPAHKLLVVLDGFDELKQDADYDKTLFSDIFQACGAQDWYAGQVKIVVTCRVRELPDAYLERQYFGHGISKNYRRRILLPFSQGKISDYLSERTTDSLSPDLELLPAEHYLQVLKSSASVKEMVRNPFVLRLFVDALPSLVKAGINPKQIQRYDIYQGFVKQWFEREVNRLDKSHRKALGVDTAGVKAVADSFESYAGILAMEMYRQDTLVVSYDESKQDNPAYAVWNRLDEVAVEADVDDGQIKATLTDRYQKLSSTEKRRLAVKENIHNEADFVAKYFEMGLETSVDQLSAKLEAFKKSSPLRQAGDQYSFIHRSFYQYFMARRVIDVAASDKPLDDRVANIQGSFSSPTGHESRRLWQEPEVLDFISEYWRKARPSDHQRLKQSWYATIESTKAHPENGVASANAATILNWVNASFAHRDLRGVQLPGVDLRRAYLTGCDLRGANLERAWLGKVQLNGADLRGANLNGTQFSERPPINLPKECNAISYHPTMPVLAAAYGKVIRQFDYASNEWLDEELVGHTGTVWSICYSPDGRWLASASWDMTVRQWNVMTGELWNEPLVGHTDRVMSVSFSPDSVWLASAGFDKSIRQWAVKTGKPRGNPLTGHAEEILCVCYSFDGLWLASAGLDKAIYQWNASNGALRGTPLLGHTHNIMSLCYSPDNKWLASCGYDKAIRQWDAASGTLRGAPLIGHSDRVTCVTYSQDGKWLASASYDKSVRQWEAASGQLRGEPLVGHSGWVRSVRYSSDGQWLVSGSEDKTIRQWEAASSELRGMPLIGHVGSVHSLYFSRDGLWLASASADKTVQQWHAATGNARGVILAGHEAPVMSVCFNEDGTRLATGSADRSVRQWTAERGEMLDDDLNGHFSLVTSVSYSSDGKWLASGSDDKTICQWETMTGKCRGESLRGHSRRVTCVTYSPNDKWIASASFDKTIQQWEAASGRVRGTPLTGHSNYVTSVCYSADGLWLASSSYDKTIRQWQASSGMLRGILVGHADRVMCVKYSPDCKWLVSGGDDKAVRQWNAYTGETRCSPLWGHTSSITSVSYSPDGQSIASCSADGTIHVWQQKRLSTSTDLNREEWQLRWGTRSILMQLSAQGLQLAGAVGLLPHHLELLRQHGYNGRTNPENGQIVDSLTREPTKPDTALLPAPESTAGDVLPMAAQAHHGAGLILKLAAVLKRPRILSPSHKLRTKLTRLYKDPCFIKTTLTEDMLRSSGLALTEKQLCKFARVNLNAARESANPEQVSDAIALFESLVGRTPGAVKQKIARTIAPDRAEKYFGTLMFGRARLEELSEAAPSRQAKPSIRK